MAGSLKLAARTGFFAESVHSELTLHAYTIFAIIKRSVLIYFSK